MKAMVIGRFGEPGVFTRVELPTPAPGPGQVLIRVAASSVNPIDCKIRAGVVPSLAPDFPAVLHGDVAGTVAAIGTGVHAFKPGDEVFGFAGGCRGMPGALAEYMVADAALLARKPPSLSMREAAALPVVGLTAWEGLIERARVQPGQRVLVHAGCGGVGHIGVQLAHVAGAFVVTTVSGEAKAEEARRLGADAVANYRTATVAEYVQAHTAGEGFDVVLDTVGGETLAASFLAARAGGTVVSIAARSTQDLSPLHGKGLTLHVVFLLLPLLHGVGRARYGANLSRLAALAEAGRVRLLLDPEEFRFEDVGAAHRKLEEGRAVGKIALESGW